MRTSNGLLRDYFPKGTDLGALSTEDLARIAAEVNDRPRKTLGWSRPADLFTTAMASSNPARRASRRVAALPRPNPGGLGRQPPSATPVAPSNDI